VAAGACIIRAVPTLESPAAWWIAIAILAAIVEISIPFFGVIFVSAGALVAALVASVGFGLTTQILIFIIAFGLSFGLVRPKLMARMSGPGVPSRTDALIGREGIVTHDIDRLVGGGRVNVGGEDWAARASESIPAGTHVKVVGSDGIILEVIPA
jgi:membrane protein implicated in regulation of membrane protease activity